MAGRRRDVGRRVAGFVVFSAALILVIGGLRTSLAEVTASTSSTGLFSAGSIELEQVGDAVELLFDEDLLYPGVSTSACVEVVYRGSVPAEVRVYAQPMGGTGLDQYIQFDVWTGDRGCPGSGPVDEPLFGETLRDFWQRHGEYGTGIVLGELEQDQRLTLMARAELGNDPAAAGLYTDFSIVVEARP